MFHNFNRNLDIFAFQIQFETLFTEANVKHLHHIILIELKRSFETEFLANNSIPPVGSCQPLAPEMHESEARYREVLKHCASTTLAWTIGGNYV